MKVSTFIRCGVAMVAILLFIALASCNNPPAQTEQANAAGSDSVHAEVTLSPELQSQLASFPAPFEITSMLYKAKAGFISDITNSPENSGKYTTEMSQALNLGVYSADLSYAATYNRTDDASKFQACTNKLAGELGIDGVNDPSLSTNSRTRVAVLIAAGGFAEGLYLAASLGAIAKDNTMIMAVISSQRESHMKLLTILEAYKADETMKPVAEAISRLKPIWGNFEIESGKKMTQQKAADIRNLVESVRLTFIR